MTALLFYATGGHQINIGDFMCMDQSTVSRIVKKVSEAIAGLRNRFIKMPATEQERITCKNNFYQIARFPRVIGCVDGTHIKIQSPGVQNFNIVIMSFTIFLSQVVKMLKFLEIGNHIFQLTHN